MKPAQGYIAVSRRRPILKGGKMIERKRVELSLPQVEALHVLKLLDLDHKLNGNPLSKSAAKKVWAHLVDAGVLKEETRKWWTKS